MTDPVQLLPMAALLALLGAIAGVAAGLLGVGGGIVLVPGFYYVFEALGYGGPGLMRVCLATSLATIIVTSSRSVLSHHAKGAVDWSVLRSWGPGIALGALVGVAVVARLRTPALQAIFGAIALVIACYMAFGRAHWRLGAQMPRGPLLALYAPLVGFLSTLLGIGGGSFGVPLMTLYGTPIHRAVATASGFGVLIAVPAVLAFLFVDVAGAPPLTLGAVNLPAFGIVIAMTLLTAPLGVRLAHGLDPVPLRRIFAVFLTAVAINMLRKVLAG